MTAWSEIDITGASVPERLSGRIAQLIDSGRVGPGSKLPSERELMTMLGASRNSIRHALQDLELRGYVTRKPRAGRIVAPVEMRALAEGSIFGVMSSDQRTVREVMDLRSVVEPPIAERAAVRHRPSEIEVLREPLETSERELSRTPPSLQVLQVCDVQFHLAIARLAHNPMLRKLVNETNEWMAPSRQTMFQTEQRMQQSVNAHRKIFHAIVDRDPARARKAMQDHLVDVLRTIEPLAG
ncbi:MULTISPECIES: FadR/GntR family transcriptional regulator [unclassified Rhodococcus (in: high G+C Gram-positive bacteria)]|uniref:FadR/GntR family transcriptional regulator n=1 Tax=unclassified Rhodococcus (in: high G+C Gram-positive bacteria) TaxID=192944 RepID=UPI0024B77219|nr:MULTISPECIES: FadR/GntR family transcriptional regulator [unclassified Rhodococcus (in: high G+C Gram-positive bacteria)]MDI9956981.1 FadR/GntR family transcriptional regulator [Rhodococcus sp. IEGM 1237]MDI9962479.1 FadR/GntR family transcriptional regulator [Rhodococcus sp. IEGM 1251]MDV8125667.1 FadR/GntR family transcriptional regulator [Rhodococcus sp. IEGM 1304]